MIRLVKGGAPPVLETNEVAWTTEFGVWMSSAAPRTPSPRRWAHHDVKERLVAETFGKCAYCESRVTHVYPGDAEHIEPKSKVPQRVVSWDNLTFACAECNRRKGDYHDPGEPLVHPYEDDPEDHIRFYGPVPLPAPGSPKGLRTIFLLELGRAELLDRRRDVVLRLGELLEGWLRESEGLAREIRRTAIVAMAESQAEYAGTVRWFLRATPEWDAEREGSAWLGGPL